MPTNTRTNQGTGFVNYNDVLDANQNSGKQLGTAIGQGLESQAGAVNSNLAGQQGQFQTGLDNANTDYSNVSKLANTLATNSTQDLSSGDYSNLSGVDPTNAAQSGQALQNYNYTGPSGLKDVSGLQSQAQSASQVGQLAGTSEGQQQLLKQYAGGNNNYTSGMGSFDQALLNKYGQGDVNQGKQSLSNISTNVNNAVNTAGSQANAAQNYVNSNKNQLLNTITDNLSGSATTPGILGQATQNENTYVNNGQNLGGILSQIGTNGVSGLTADQYAQLQTLIPNMSSLGINTGQTYDMGTVANDQTAQNNAIAGLNSVNSAGLAGGGQYRFNDPNQYSAANLLNSFIGNGPSAITNNTATYFNPNANQSQINQLTSNDQAAQQAANAGIGTVNNIGNTIQHGFTGGGNAPTTGTSTLANQIASLSPQEQQAIFGTSDPTAATNGVISGFQSIGPGENFVEDTAAQQSQAQQYANAAAAYQQYVNNGVSSGTNSIGNFFNQYLNNPQPTNASGSTKSTKLT